MSISGRIDGLIRRYPGAVFAGALPAERFRRLQVISLRVRTGTLSIPADYLRDAPPVWEAWLETLRGKRVDAAKVWRRLFEGAGAFCKWGVEEPVEAFVLRELTTLHAAFGLAVAMRDPGMLRDLEPVVQWHVENTQPDAGTEQPWALAAFAALDASGMFADAQMHQAEGILARTAPESEEHQFALSLLHDAELTLSPGGGREGAN